MGMQEQHMRMADDGALTFWKISLPKFDGRRGTEGGGIFSEYFSGRKHERTTLVALLPTYQIETTRIFSSFFFFSS